MSFDRIVSVNLYGDSNQLTACRVWWEETLGIPVGRSSESVLTFYLGNSTLLNFHAATEENRALAGRHSGVTLRVPSTGDLSRILSRMRNKGVAIAANQLRPFYSGHQLLLTDPAGNTVSLIEADEFNEHPHMFEAPAYVSISVSRLRQSLDFYVGRLEMPMLDQLGPNVARLMSNGTHILLTERAPQETSISVQGDTGICLAVDDPHYLFGQLEGRGVRFKDAPVTIGNTMLASVNDPDGNTLTLLGAE